MNKDCAESATAACAAVPAGWATGRVSEVGALAIEIAGLSAVLAVGDRVIVHPRAAPPLPAEIVAARGGRLLAAPFGATLGLGANDRACAPLAPGRPLPASLAPSRAWLGRVLDPLGRPMDGRPPPAPGPPRPVRAPPPSATARARLGPPLDLGVAALTLFAPCRTGQRLGLFAASGVGKSTLLAMLARHAAADVTVLALVGERGREVREFLEDDLDAGARAATVAIVATADAPPLLRREAAYAAMTVAEHFRDAGRSVLLLMDSVTRFALALRELGLAAGEPPATRGYPPSVFAELPRLLERAGPGTDGAGQITGLFTVLVEGDDHDEPIADAVRGILDGHVVLERAIAEAGRYPAVNVLRSLSRTAGACLSAEQSALVGRARALLALHADMADMIRLGAYKPGSDPATDDAIRRVPAIEAVLKQLPGEPVPATEAFAALAAALA